ncbi:MAG: SDR family oxidoreductase [Actinomycetota bacterium]
MDEFKSPLAPDANAGRVAVVTGGGTGIGRAITRELARTGAKVAICGRRGEPLAAVARELEAAGAECIDQPCDIREPEQVAGFLNAVDQSFGGADILVNNAGGQFGNTPENVSLKGWRAVHLLTVDAAWNMTHEVANRWMIPGRGGFVGFIGFSPRRGIPQFAHASAARAALENLAQGLSQEWSRYGIRTVAVVPGYVDTEGAREAYGDEEMDKSAKQIPIGRLVTAEEVAALVAYLTTPAAAAITGTSVVIDGGLDAWGIGEPPPPPE